MRVNQKIMNRSLDKKINVLKDIVTKQAQIKFRGVTYAKQ
jgi:hypothetical protein